MNIKSAIIKTIDWLIYLALAFILLIGLITAFAMGQPFQAGLFILFGWLLVSMLVGFWFVLSSICDNTARQVVLTEKNNALLGKIYKELQENRNNPFDML